MGDRLAVSRIASYLRGGGGFVQNVRCVQQIGVRFASGGAANPAREAKAASPSKVVKKGGTAAKDEGFEKRDKFATILQACLDAPSPVRHLKEKERLRELEREKLGLVSKEKERALERDKAKAKAIAKEKKKSGRYFALEISKPLFLLTLRLHLDTHFVDDRVSFCFSERTQLTCR